MEHPAAPLARSLITILKVFQVIIGLWAIEAFTQFIADKHLYRSIRNFVLLYLNYAHGLERDPAIPRRPADWAEWYGS